MLCYDDGLVFVDPETPFSVVDGASGAVYEYQHHPRELLGAEPSSVSAFVHDGGCWANTTGVSSSSSSSSVATFDGHGKEHWHCPAWMGDTDQLGYGAPAPCHAEGPAATPNFFGFDAGNCVEVSASKKRPRAHAPSQQQGPRQEAATIAKKQCGGKRTDTKPAKAPTATARKEPQSTAAKNRRERVNERLKVLQELVPNGRKVDTVTMLDKAITYVKFMQLQLKVLETDAFWPTREGKAPEMSQVKEALNAILLSPSYPRQHVTTD